MAVDMAQIESMLGKESAETYLNPHVDTPDASPRTPRFDKFIDLEHLSSKLLSLQQNPQTPITTPTNSVFDARDTIEIDRDILKDWGLNDAEIDRARRWDQKPLHRSAESIHMRLLSECAASLIHGTPSLTVLFHEYERKMTEYNRRLEGISEFAQAQTRAQQAVDNLVSEMRLHGSAFADMSKFYEATAGGEVTLRIVAEYCDLKRKALRRDKKKTSKRSQARQKQRRSRRIRNLPPVS